LAKTFKVTEVTICQSLEKLESEGFNFWEHIGAFLTNVEHSVKSFTLINQDNPEKRKLSKTTKLMHLIKNKSNN
jgi:hypothetical protein